MLILNILGLGLWLLIALVLLRFVAKNINALLAMGLFVAGYLALFNTLGTMFGDGLVVWGGLIGLGVMGRTLATRLGMRRPGVGLRAQLQANAQEARITAEAERLASQDAFHNAHWAKYDAEQEARRAAEANFDWMDKLRNG